MQKLQMKMSEMRKLVAVMLKLHLGEKLEWGGDSSNSCKKEKKVCIMLYGQP